MLSANSMQVIYIKFRIVSLLLLLLFLIQWEWDTQESCVHPPFLYHHSVQLLHQTWTKRKLTGWVFGLAQIKT